MQRPRRMSRTKRGSYFAREFVSIKGIKCLAPPTLFSYARGDTTREPPVHEIVVTSTPLSPRRSRNNERERENLLARSSLSKLSSSTFVAIFFYNLRTPRKTWLSRGFVIAGRFPARFARQQRSRNVSFVFAQHLRAELCVFPAYRSRDVPCRPFLHSTTS